MEPLVGGRGGGANLLEALVEHVESVQATAAGRLRVPPGCAGWPWRESVRGDDSVADQEFLAAVAHSCFQRCASPQCLKIAARFVCACWYCAGASCCKAADCAMGRVNVNCDDTGSGVSNPTPTITNVAGSQTVESTFTLVQVKSCKRRSRSAASLTCIQQVPSTAH